MSSAVLEPVVQTFEIVLNFNDVLKKLNDDDFEAFCRHNPEIRIELTKEGELVIMPPTGGLTGRRNFSLIGHFFNWVERDGTGIGFDSSTAFKLPNGAKRSPDLSWVRREKWDQLSATEQEKFPPLCPDFVVELRSASDSLSDLRAKMEEYIDCGAELGWLIDAEEKKVYVYRQNETEEILENPAAISGDPLLQNFTLNLTKIW
jgi:Uma2 family endonuclease